MNPLWNVYALKLDCLTSEDYIYSEWHALYPESYRELHKTVILWSYKISTLLH